MPLQKCLLTPTHGSEGNVDEETSPSPLHQGILSPLSPPSPSMRPYRRSVEALKKVRDSKNEMYFLSNYHEPNSLQVVLGEPPYPMVVRPLDGGYWVQNGEFDNSQGEDGIWRAPEISTDHFRVEVDNTSLMYGRHFANKVSKTATSVTRHQVHQSSSLSLPLSLCRNMRTTSSRRANWVHSSSR